MAGWYTSSKKFDRSFLTKERRSTRTKVENVKEEEGTGDCVCPSSSDKPAASR